MRITLLEDDFLSVETGNNREVESSLRELPSSRWIASENRWEVHLAHLPDLVGLFRLKPDRLPEELMQRFQREWLSTDVRLEIEHSTCRALGAGVPVREIDDLCSYEVAERTEDSAYLEGEWDGRKHLYDRRTFMFPTGMLAPVRELLKERKLRMTTLDRREAYVPGPELTAKQLAKLPPEDRALIESARTLGRMTAIREGIQGEHELLRALVLTLGPTAVVLAGSQEEADEIGAGIGEATIRVFRTAKDLDAPRLVIALPDAAALFTHLEREGARVPMPPEDKRKALMIGLRLRRERVLIAPRACTVDGDLLYRTAMGAQGAAVRIALSRLPSRGDGRNILLEAAFGPRIPFMIAADRVRAGKFPPVRLFRVRAPEYRRVERDKPYEVIVVNGLFRNEARMEALSNIVDLENAAGRRVLVTARNPEFRPALEKLLEGRAKVSPAFVETALLSSMEKPGDDIPTAVLFAEPVTEPGFAVRLLLALCEAHVRRGKMPEFIPIYDFDDPLPGLRRRNELRFAMYARLAGWVDEYTLGPNPRMVTRAEAPSERKRSTGRPDKARRRRR